MSLKGLILHLLAHANVKGEFIGYFQKTNFTKKPYNTKKTYQQAQRNDDVFRRRGAGRIKD